MMYMVGIILKKKKKSILEKAKVNTLGKPRTASLIAELLSLVILHEFNHIKIYIC